MCRTFFASDEIPIAIHRDPKCRSPICNYTAPCTIGLGASTQTFPKCRAAICLGSAHRRNGARRRARCLKPTGLCMRRDLRAPIVSAVLILTGTSVTAATRVMDPETPSARSEARVQSGQIPGIGWKTADQVPVWKTIRLGGYGSVNALREALDSEGCVPGGLAAGDRRRVVRTASRPTHGPDCRLGESAAELIGRPAFHLSRAKDAVDLV